MNKEIEELLKKKKIPWLKIVKLGGNLKEILWKANADGDVLLAKKARNALNAYGGKT